MPDTRILIVDDERTTRSMLHKGLQKEGYAIAEAAHGSEALEKIDKFDPHLILLDIMMPGVPGNELIERIKEWKPEIEIIMVTVVQKEGVQAECFFKGAFDVITKPVDMEHLQRTIKEALGKRRKKPNEEAATPGGPRNQNTAALEELALANLRKIDAVINLLEDREILTRQDVLGKIKEMKGEKN